MGEADATTGGSESGPHRDWVQSVSKIAVYLLVIGGGYWCLTVLSDVLVPVFISLVVAYLLDPVIDWFEERSVPRTPAIALVVLAGLVFIAVFVLFLYPTVVEQVRRISENLPKLGSMLQERTIPWIERTFDVAVPSRVSEIVERYGESITDAAPAVVGNVGTWLGNVALGTGAFVGRLVNLVMIPIFIFFFLRDFDRIVEGLREFLPQRRRGAILERLQKMDEVVGDWCRGQVQVALILSVLYGIGLAIAFHIAGLDMKSGIAIGVLSGVINVIPYVGVMVGIVLSVLLLLLSFAGITGYLAVAAVFFAVQMLEGYLITPRIVGEKVGLKPVTVIIVLLIGGELFGLLGFVLAIPVFGALKVLFPDIVAYYKASRFYRRAEPGQTGAGDDDGEDDPAGSADETDRASSEDG